MQTNPVKVIREKCLDCCCGQYSEVEKCGIKDCPLHSWRFGKNPYRRKRELTEEEKAIAAERLRVAREKRTQAPDGILRGVPREGA